MGSYEGGGYASGNYRDPQDSGSKNIREMMDWRYTASYPANGVFWQQGAIDKRFKAGDQSLWSAVYGDNNYYQSRRYFFNLIRRHLNMINGYQRKNRKSTITLPQNDNEDPLADDYNKVLKWSEDRDGFQEYLSQSFESSNDTGINLLHLYPDYTLDPISGDLFTDSVGYCNFLIDPYFRKQDLTDCGFVWRRRWCNKNSAKALLPERAKEIDKMRVDGQKDGRFPLQAELLNLDTNRLWAFDEFHYRDTRLATLVIDPKTGESTEWEEEGDEDSEELLKRTIQQQPWLIIKKTYVPTVKLAIQLAGQVFYDGPNLLGIDPYPFVPTLCYHEPDIQAYAWRVQGIIRNLRDAQYLYNMRKVIELDILQSQITSGWIYPVDVVTDPKAFRQSGQGFLIPLKAGHLPGEIQRLEAPNIPQSVIELSRSLAEDITKISGVNEELLGAATDDKSGILSMLRQGAGLVTLQTIFDKLDYSQRLFGKIRLEAIRKKFSKGKIRSILGHEADPRFFTTYALKYSISVEEGNYTTTQRQMELQQLLHFKELGMQIPDEAIIKAAFITNKKQIVEQMQQASQQAAEQAQAQAQSQQEAEKSKVMSAYAKSKADLARERDLDASAQGKLSKIGLDASNAEYAKAKSDLELVKMMVELEHLDMDHIGKMVAVAQAIKSMNNPETLETNNVVNQ